MNKKLLSILIGISAMSITTVIRAESLIDVYSMAISSDPQLQSAYATRMSTREAFPLALSGFLPAISGNASYNSSNSDYNASMGLIVSGLSQQTLDRNQQLNALLSQTIFDLSRWHTLKQSRQTVSYADAVYMASEQDLIIRTASTYFNLLNAMDQLAFIQAEKRAVGRQLDQTNEKFNV
jgi:outer membrane protein